MYFFIFWKSSAEIPSSAQLSNLNLQEVIDVSNIQAATGSRSFQFVGNAAITGRSDLQAGIPAHFSTSLFSNPHSGMCEGSEFY